SAGGPLVVDTVSGVSVDVEGVVAVQFNSTTEDASRDGAIDSLEDLATTVAGPVKVVVEAGTLTIEGGADTSGVSAAADGNVLLEARGTAADVVLNSSVASGSGHVTVSAADDVDVNGPVTTGGVGTLLVRAGDNSADAVGPEVDGINVDGVLTTAEGDVLVSSLGHIRQTALVTTTDGDVGLVATGSITQTSGGDVTTAEGDVLVDALGDWTMAPDAVVTSGGSDVLGRAAGTITLGVIRVTHAVTNRVALEAGGSVLDGNLGAVNVEETVPTASTSVSLRATAGSIGLADDSNGDPPTNANAVDLDVDTAAAEAAAGIYLREVSAGGPLVVDTVSGVSVDVEGVVAVQFNSTTEDASRDGAIDSLEDLAT
ncbi:MAG: hypothetical protein GY849_24375, partial [Deltaproteobacteria bacterium]|nr:hypothetical protein [Deltaproteobacteria bacterium]